MIIVPSSTNGTASSKLELLVPGGSQRGSRYRVTDDRRRATSARKPEERSTSEIAVYFGVTDRYVTARDSNL